MKSFKISYQLAAYLFYFHYKQYWQYGCNDFSFEMLKNTREILLFNGAKLCYNPLERFYYVAGYHYNNDDLKALGFRFLKCNNCQTEIVKRYNDTKKIRKSNAIIVCSHCQRESNQSN